MFYLIGAYHYYGTSIFIFLAESLSSFKDIDTGVIWFAVSSTF